MVVRGPLENKKKIDIDALIDKGAKVKEDYWEEKKWIRVKDHPPEVNGEFLVTDGEEIEIMTYFGMYKGSHDWSSKNCCTLDVTHWMPLPEPPTGN